jgi:hypothetical protein
MSNEDTTAGKDTYLQSDVRIVLIAFLRVGHKRLAVRQKHAYGVHTEDDLDTAVSTPDPTCSLSHSHRRDA